MLCILNLIVLVHNIMISLINAILELCTLVYFQLNNRDALYMYMYIISIIEEGKIKFNS